MTAFLRFIGILNAALWLGASVFLIIGLPAVFSDELKNRITGLGPGWAAQLVPGWAAQLIIARFFILQYCCCGVAFVHLVLEWYYGGKPVLRKNLSLLAVLAAFALAGGLWMQPKLNELHHLKYYGATDPVRTQAGHAFALWHGGSECGNLIVIIGLLIYLWRVSQPRVAARFASMNLDKIRC